MMDFEATCLYPSAMYNEKSVSPRIESGFAFKPHMNDVYVEAFNFQTFNQLEMKTQFEKVNVTVLLILSLNIYWLRRMLNISK